MNSIHYLVKISFSRLVLAMNKLHFIPVLVRRGILHLRTKTFWASCSSSCHETDGSSLLSSSPGFLYGSKSFYSYFTTQILMKNSYGDSWPCRKNIRPMCRARVTAQWSCFRDKVLSDFFFQVLWSTWSALRWPSGAWRQYSTRLSELCSALHRWRRGVRGAPCSEKTTTLTQHSITMNNNHYFSKKTREKN